MIPLDHPRYLEPPQPCNDSGCVYCPLYTTTRAWIDTCYNAQHQVNGTAETKGVF